jgi:signal transduction histidine kinase
MGKDNKTDMTETPHDAAADPQQIIAELQRNLNERTAERDESLTYQTAISNVLNVISRSPSDIQPVLDTIAETAQQLCESEHAYIFRFDGDKYHLVAARDVRAERIAFLKDNPIVPNRGSTVGRVALERRPVHVMDALADNEYKLSLVGHGGRTILGVPLLRDGIAIGVIVLTRGVVRPFVERQIQLVSTFADQALIAIENVRLFNETREALERQTSTAEILKVIASSPSDVQPVFDAIAASANRLLGGFSSTVFRFIDGMAHLKAFTPTTPEADEILQSSFPQPVADFAPFQMTQAGEAMQIPDTEAPTYELKEIARARGYRSMLYVPLMSKGVSIGFTAVTRVQPGPFADHHLQLLQTFADQAVIAIENARLFDEVQAKTRDLTESLEQQTATSEVLQVISSSPGELEPVFQKMLENATRVCGANFGIMNLWDGERFNIVAGHNVPPAFVAFRKQNAHRSHPEAPLAAVDQTHQFVHVPDMRNNRAYLASDPNVVALVDIAGARTLVIVPMLKEDELIGTISIFRQETRPFTDKQIALVQNFTKQAVIAIENTRLLRELRERTTELSLSLEELRTAQDRLVQTEKLASLGQLTAGIAHEIKNPLNFVNNFSALSTELIEEMKDMLSDVNLDKNKREDLDEITQMLTSNLDKVVQHGKRADSIVKNMLLHSRQGSGEHRPVDINAVVDESLNLAYHGARAENTGFNITMHRSFDLAVGMADGYPQEITRALLNLISNGFYAATKRKADAGDGFEPTLTATTRNLGDKVEIRIRDNGTGITAEVKEKIFNPFFTTKPAGEGTGLGLSMSHDIIVKQHGGTMDVDTVPGVFTEFKIVLPRTGTSLIKRGERP